MSVRRAPTTPPHEGSPTTPPRGYFGPYGGRYVPETMLAVGVFVGEYEDVGTDLVQLYAEENGHRAREGVLLREGAEVARVLDLPWLEEDAEHWSRARTVNGRVVLAGGLGPENVRAAIEAVRPWCVDASRSLESSPGVKDHARVRAYIEAVRG